jgi:parallel beta-helix repeat protein
MHDSIARNNSVSNEGKCIFISQSHNNEISNNRVSACDIGINLSANSSKNTIFNNTITNSTNHIVVDKAGTGNKLYSNKVTNTDTKKQ